MENSNIDSEIKKICKSGIYRIRNLIDDKAYIGSAKNLKSRKSTHFAALRNNRHVNIYLQRAWNKYGEKNFVFEILEYIDDLNLLTTIEQNYIDFFISQKKDSVYNIRKIARSNLGISFSEEVSQKISAKLLGKEKSPEARANMSNAMMGNTKWLGKKHSAETRNKMSAWQIGRELPVSTKAKLSNNSYNSKLSVEEVREIRELLSDGVKSVDICKKYGISAPTVSRIKTGKSWRYTEYGI